MEWGTWTAKPKNENIFLFPDYSVINIISRITHIKCYKFLSVLWMQKLTKKNGSFPDLNKVKIKN